MPRKLNSHPVHPSIAPISKKDICNLLGACEARICRVMEICGLGTGGDGDSNVPRNSTAYSAEEAAAQQHSFWHSGLNTSVVRPGSEPATEGDGA